MDPKDPILGKQLLTYLWVLGVSIWGGTVSYFEKHIEQPKFSWKRFMAHLLSASFAGFMTYLISDYTNMPGSLACVFSGVAAHMGTPALLRLKFVDTFLNRGKM